MKNVTPGLNYEVQDLKVNDDSSAPCSFLKGTGATFGAEPSWRNGKFKGREGRSGTYLLEFMRAEKGMLEIFSSIGRLTEGMGTLLMPLS